MSHTVATPVEGEQRLGKVNTFARWAMIAVALAAVAGTFAYLGGWFTPNRLTPARFVDGFEQVSGKHPGFRRNHAKGVDVSGFFESNGNGTRFSKAVVFRTGRVPVVGRFSLGGGLPDMADMPGAVRGLGMAFSLPDGEEWRTAMINLPVFPFRTPEAFYEQMLASKPDPKTGKPDPALMQAFVAHHPEFEHALTIIKGQPASSGFANSTFHSLNAFRFTNAAGEATPVRWVLTPVQPFEPANMTATPENRDYLFDAMIAAIHRQPLQWHLTLLIGQPGDPTDDASIVWPAEREKVDVGTLTLDQAQAEDTSTTTNINFDPLVLPDGISSSDDPLLSARSAVYSQSFTRRAGEAKPPSAIKPGEVK